MNAQQDQNEVPTESLFVSRQPVFDREKDIWGYELKFCCAHEDGVEPRSMCAAVLDSLPVALQGIDPKKNILVEVAVEAMNEDLACLIPGSQCILSIRGGIVPGSKAFQAMVLAKERGCRVVVDYEEQLEGFEQVAPYADHIRVRMEGLTPREVVSRRKELKPFESQLMAAGVNEWEAYEGSRALGFKVFQGDFFCQPEIVKDKTPAASKITRIRLFKELTDPECEIKELSKIISADVALSYRLLRFINSAAFGLANKIQSIQQASSLLGINALRKWAMVAITADLDSTPKGGELTYHSLQRGRFLETLCGCFDRCIYPPEGMFLFGLFSRLDALLGLPMREIVAELPLHPDFNAALCGEKNDALQWLYLLTDMEAGEWEDAAEIIKKMGGTPAKAAALYMQASSWAAEALQGG